MPILIIDDSDSSRLLLASMLREAGYRKPLLAGSAGEAFELLAENCGEDGECGVDLALMDIVMPDMDGIEATARLKGDPRWRDIPVIMVTVRDEPVSLERALEAGAMDYIGKPVNAMELRARVRSALRLKREIDRRKARERELEALTSRLEALSRVDGLTGAANRRFFDETFLGEWRRCRRENAALSLLMIDIDHFKKYNDAYGHVQGDACLCSVVKAIRAALKRPGDFLARIGGEEFAAILPDTEIAGALAIAESIRNNLRRMGIEHKGSESSDEVTVSIGAATAVPVAESEPESLLRAADAALYQSKDKGRDRVETAGPGSSLA